MAHKDWMKVLHSLQAVAHFLELMWNVIWTDLPRNGADYLMFLWEMIAESLKAFHTECEISVLSLASLSENGLGLKLRLGLAYRIKCWLRVKPVDLHRLESS